MSERPSNDPRSAGPNRRSPSAYFAALLLGLVVPVLAYAGTILGLERFAPEHLPPPPISNRIDLDDKLRLLHDTAANIRPVVLALGSSSTARSIAGDPFQGADRKPLRFFNASAGGVQINQMRFLARFYLAHFRGTKVVISMLVPADFRSCSADPMLFDRTDAAAYAFGKAPLLPFYLEYFSLLDFIADLPRIAAQRKNWGADQEERRHYIDRFGSKPMEIDPTEARSRLEIYAVEPLDQHCFDELRAWSHDIEQAGARLLVILPPVSPLWLGQTAGAEAFLEDFRGRVRSALAGAPADLVDGQEICHCGPYDFVDAYHLQWTAAQRFSEHLAAEINGRVEAAAATPDQPS